MRQDVAPSDRCLLFRLGVCLYLHKAARVSPHGDADRGRHGRLVAEEAEIFLVSLAQIGGRVGNVGFGARPQAPSVELGE
jgi:hypothetical protein